MEKSFVQDWIQAEEAGSSSALELRRPKDPNNGVPRGGKWAPPSSSSSISWVGVPDFLFLSFFFYFFPFYFFSQAWSEHIHSLFHLSHVFSFPGFGVFGYFVILVFLFLCMWIWRTFLPPVKTKGPHCFPHSGVVQDSDAHFSTRRVVPVLLHEFTNRYSLGEKQH